jgi:hypothetical protein
MSPIIPAASVVKPTGKEPMQGSGIPKLETRLAHEGATAVPPPLVDPAGVDEVLDELLPEEFEPVPAGVGATDTVNVMGAG